jgi:hypothetical protein
MKKSFPMSVRVLAVALLLNCLLFFQGCDKNDKSLQCSLGVAAPFAKLKVATRVGMGMLPSRLFDLSPVLMLVNAAVGLLLGIAFLQLPTQRRAWLSLFLAWGLTNSLLVLGVVWIYVVGFPILAIHEILWPSHSPALPANPPAPAVLIPIASRLWLAIMFGLFYGLPPVIACVLPSWSRTRRA